MQRAARSGGRRCRRARRWSGVRYEITPRRARSRSSSRPHAHVREPQRRSIRRKPSRARATSARRARGVRRGRRAGDEPHGPQELAPPRAAGARRALASCAAQPKDDSSGIRIRHPLCIHLRRRTEVRAGRGRLQLRADVTERRVQADVPGLVLPARLGQHGGARRLHARNRSTRITPRSRWACRTSSGAEPPDRRRPSSRRLHMARDFEDMQRHRASWTTASCATSCASSSRSTTRSTSTTSRSTVAGRRASSLAGRVGTDGERRIAEHVLTDVLGISDFTNELVVDPIRRAESPMDDRRASRRRGGARGHCCSATAPVPLSPEAEHLADDAGRRPRRHDGLQDVDRRRRDAGSRPESRRRKGCSGTDAEPRTMGEQH